MVNMASLAGKIGLPASAPYGTTKAGLVMFTHSLRTELVDTPVGASVICPGFVADVGKYARVTELGVRAPKRLRSTTAAKVADAVIRATRRNTAEILVNPPPTRPLMVLKELVPWITPYIHKVLGTVEFARDVANRGRFGRSSRPAPSARPASSERDREAPSPHGEA